MEHLLFNNLSDVMTHLGCYDQAEAHLGEALALARRTCNHVAEARVFEGLSRLAHHRNDQKLAEAYVRQALSWPGNGDHGWYLTTLANVLEAQGRLSEAAETFAEAARWWNAQADPEPIVETLAGLSRIALARGALPDAVAHAEEMYRHLHGRLKILEPLRMYLTCWQIFHATSDPRAEAVLRHASTLLAEQAARIDDPQLRRSFLEHVATHRQITTAAARNLYAPIELLVL